MKTNELLISSLKPNLTKTDYAAIASELVAAGYYHTPGMKFYTTAIAGDIQNALVKSGTPVIPGVLGEATTTINRIECAANALKKALKAYTSK